MKKDKAKMPPATLLIVDDELESRRMLERHFRFDGFQVETAADGVEALVVLGRTRVDVMISDIKMPNMDGVSLLREVRRQYPMVKVIMITGYVSLENALACMRNQAETCVFKPFADLGELDTAVKRALEALARWRQKFKQLQGMRDDAVGDDIA